MPVSQDLMNNLRIALGRSGGEEAITALNTSVAAVADDTASTFGTDDDSVIYHKSGTNAANTGITGVLDGTPVTPALAANSLIVSNTTASGDILLAADRGGNSENYLFVDSSAGDLYLYAPAGEILLNPTTDVQTANGTGIVVGHTAQLTISDGDGATDCIPELQVLGTAKADGSMVLAVHSTTATSAAAPSLNFVKSAAAAIGTATVVVSGEVLGEVNFFGANGTDYESCGVSIRGVVDTTPGAADMPGRLAVFCSADGGETPLEKCRITGAAATALLTMGVAGTSTGSVVLSGATSGTTTVSAQAAAGAWTMALPAAVGSAGQQLTDAAGNGVCSWAAASLGEWKNDLGILDPYEALKAVLSAPTHRFTYNKAVLPVGQWDGNGSEMTGIFAEEAPWAMHGERDGLKSGIAFSPVNAFGYARAAIEALAAKIESLEKKLGLNKE